MHDLLCCKCNNYLSVPPITYKNGFLCGRCSTTNKNRLYCYELIAEKLKFSCCYKLNGCNEQRLFDIIGRHEVECDKRILICPICNIDCIESDLERHLSEHHRDIFIDNNLFQLKMNQLVTKRIIFNENNKLFLITTVQYENCLTIKVYYFGKNFDKDYMNYKVHIHSKCMSESINLSRKPIQRYGNEKNKHYITEIDTRLIKLLSNDTVWLEIQLAPNYCMERTIHQQYLPLLECPICFEYMSETSQCNNGHTFCTTCLKRVKTCPICQCELTNESANFIANSLYQQVYLPCPNAPHCHYMGQHKNRKLHAENCFICPAKDCPMYGNVDELTNHCLIEHQVLFTNIENGICNLNVHRTMVLFYIDNKIFKYCRQSDEHFIYWTVMMVGRKFDSYEFIVQLINNGKIWSFREKCKQLDNNYGDKTNYFSLPLNWLKCFINKQNSIKCNISICKIKC